MWEDRSADPLGRSRGGGGGGFGDGKTGGRCETVKGSLLAFVSVCVMFFRFERLGLFVSSL